MIADSRLRERALDPARSFLVQAPAGSGKTELLIRRYLRLLSVVERPEEILAITFTRKAAAEMRKRVLAQLPDAGAVSHRLRIMTIDAFCASLTRQMPVLARFGAQPEMLEDASDLYREAALRVLAELPPAAERLLARLDNDIQTAARLLASMLARRDQWLRKTGAPPARAELEAALAGERERLLAKARSLDARASEEFARQVLAKDGSWRTRSKEARSLAHDEPLREALAALLELPPPKYEEAQWQVLEAVLELLKLAAAHLKVLFSERGAADFTEVAQAALRALGEPGDPTDLALALDHRIHHVLVDEFQDTSFSQWQLLERLTDGWQAGDGRTLFLVGDPMQSIYRFREAQVGLFLRARANGLPNVALEPLVLSANFRSQGALVEWCNRVFPRLFPRQADETAGAVPFAPSSAVKDSLPGEAASCELFSSRQAEAARVAELAAKAEGSCAILVRNRAHLEAVVPALKAAGVRYRAIEIEHLGDKQVVQDLYALTRALTHLGDRIAWLAILRAPWAGLSLEELSKFFEGGTGETVWETLQSVGSLSRLREILAPALERRERGTLRDRVEGVWLALGGPACVASATDLEDAEIFLDALERLETAGGIDDPRSLAEQLQRLYALADLGAGAASVQILTIHKAKGLEFGTVIVPGLDRPPGRGDPPLLLWKEQPDKSLLLAPIRQTGAAEDPAYEYLRRLEREAEDIEAARLLYVAATRAERRLHLLGCARRDEEGIAVPPNPRSLLGIAWDALSESIRWPPPGAERGRPVVENLPPVPLARLAPEFCLPPPPAPLRWRAPAAAGAAAPIEYSWAGETARHVGTVVHRWLRRIAEEALEGWDAKRLEALQPAFEIELRSLGVPGEEVCEAAGLVAEALENALADPRGRWLLGPHPEARSECRIRTPSARYAIDRVFTDEAGVRWVVDFKTSRHLGADLEAFLDREQQRYRAQLDAYAEALGASRRGIFFPLHRAWREW